MSVDRSRLPEPGPIRSFRLPAIDKSTLPNGLRVWTVSHDQVPVVSFSLLVRRGAADDPPGKDGLAALTADMLDEGSGDRSAIDMYVDLARLGAHLDTDIGSDATLAGMTILSRAVDRALVLLADIVVRPALREEDFLRVRQLRLHRLTQLRDVAGAVADRAFVRLAYGTQPYGHTPVGSESTLAGLSVDDVRAFHAREIEPSSSTLIAVGDCSHEAVCRLAADAFAGWQTHTDTREAAEAPPSAAVRLNVVARPGAAQSELRIGHVAVARDTPDYHALVVANMVLGGQFVSRINLNLRQDKGFTYGAHSSFDFRRRPGPFLLHASVETRSTVRAVQESIGEITAILGPRPITASELVLGTAALTRGYARNFETADQIARAVTQLALYDLPDDYYAQFVPNVERVTAEEATSAMARHIDPSRLITLIVGDLDVVGPDLHALGLGAPTVLSADAF